MYYKKYMTKVTELYFLANDEYLLAIQVEKPSREYVEKETSIIKEAFSQVELYLEGKLKEFDLPLLIRGSEFEKQVYDAMINVSYGELATYKDLANKVNSPKAYRAVGSTCGKNPYLIVVPCHRIIKTDKGLGGYSSGLDVKVKLLELEGHSLQNCKVK